MGPSVSFPLSFRIAQNLPFFNSWELINIKLPMPLPILYYFELIREVLANTLCLGKRVEVPGILLPDIRDQPIFFLLALFLTKKEGEPPKNAIF